MSGARAGAGRALSFIGLGLALIGLSLFYQRVVFKAGPEGAGDEWEENNGEGAR